MTLPLHPYLPIIAVCYILMDPLAGGLAASAVAAVYLASSKLVFDPEWSSKVTSSVGMPVWKLALAIHLTGWILQFIGHGVFEGN